MMSRLLHTILAPAAHAAESKEKQRGTFSSGWSLQIKLKERKIFLKKMHQNNNHVLRITSSRSTLNIKNTVSNKAVTKKKKFRRRVEIIHIQISKRTRVYHRLLDLYT